MRKTLVTGAAGFIGYRVAQSLAQEGHSLVLCDRVDHFSSRTQEHESLPEAQIVDRQDLAQWLGDYGSSIGSVIHMGACARTTEFDRAFLREVNVEYSQMLWTFCSRARIPFVYASSAATYGDGAQGYSDDEHAMKKLRPLNPYGESKLIFDLWAIDQEKSGNAPPSWSGFKFFNVYGFGERHKGSMASVVLQAFDQIERMGKIKLFRSHRTDYADGEQKRDFVAVEDVVDVLRFAVQKPIRRGIFNLGAGQARSFLDLARAVFKELGLPEKIDFIDTPAEIRDKYQYFTQAQMEKLRKAGYEKPFLSLEEGVSRYIKRLQRVARYQ